jgi:branched-chain amino acid transport system ATP-binding protein
VSNQQRPVAARGRGPAGAEPDIGLRVDDVTVRFGGNPALEDVSFAARRGEVLALIGPNGAGKSTMLKTIAGLQRPTAGRVELQGEDVSDVSFRGRATRGLALTFQIPRSATALTVEEQIAGQAKGFRHVRFSHDDAALERVSDVIARVGLADAARKRTRDLTLGEIRRFEVARALVNQPNVLLVDEPASGMSSDEAKQLVEVLRAVADGGVTVVLVEHNIPFVSALARRTVVLSAGRLLIEGETAEVLASPTVKEAYLGQAAA